MAKQETQSLFEESSQGAVSAVTGIVFVLSVILLFGGFVLMSYTFDVLPDGGQPAFWMFWVGLLSSVLGCAIPFTLLPALGK